MIKKLDLTLAPEIAFDDERFKEFAKKRAGLKDEDTQPHVRMLRRSIDARSQKIKVKVHAEVYIDELPTDRVSYKTEFPDVSNADPVVIVGSGPAGMFAALRLIELGLKPIIVERGKDVKERIKDIAQVSRRHDVNPDSNYCFGEGGAGTYSDGKLYTRSGKRGDMRRILEIFHVHGAGEEILVDSHPHIGTNRLPKIIEAMRENILSAGGQIHFGTRVEDFIITDGTFKGVIDQNGNQITGIGTILATGHSARDIFSLLQKHKIEIEAKEFALGVRVEHPQLLIDQQQYHAEIRDPFLPAASYSLTAQTYRKGKAKGVYSFCMCPGGHIVPAATANGEIVVNGMSNSYRSSKYANSGIVVTVTPEDLKPFKHLGKLAGVGFQQHVEQAAAKPSGGKQTAPAQRLTDFISKRDSKNLPRTSYQPGVMAANLWEVLPLDIATGLSKGFQIFGKKIKGYLTEEAVLLATESRTSSPIRVPRDNQTCEHPQIKGLYPCGEGAGYAGGILSAAMDGERCAIAIARKAGKTVE